MKYIFYPPPPQMCLQHRHQNRDEGRALTDAFMGDPSSSAERAVALAYKQLAEAGRRVR